MRADVLQLLRDLRRSPGSAAAAILTLALTLGAGASIFAVVDAVLLTPPPFANPEALVTLSETPLSDPAAAPRRASYATYEAWRDRAKSMAAVEAFEGTNLTLTEIGAAERLSVTDVTPGFLPLLGVAPALGRAFQPDDVGRPLAIVSHGFWRTRLAADPMVVGRAIVLGGQSHTIVAVLPEWFLFEFNPSDVWRPIPLSPAQAARRGYPVGVIARLNADVSPASLAQALDEVSRRSSPPARVSSIPVMTAISGHAAGTLGLLAAAAAIAMVIAFTNLAGLLIVRTIDRCRELAVRAALGAQRSDLIRLLLLEAQTLVAAGMAGGVLVALWTTPVVGRLALQQFGGVAHRHVSLSWHVIGVVALAASVFGWLCVLTPARVAARADILDLLRRGAASAPREVLLRRVLVTAQVALAFVLLVCVTLVGQSLSRILNVNPGFDARGVLALPVSLPRVSYSPERVMAFYAAVQGALEERLGREAVAIVDELPLTGVKGRIFAGEHGNESRREAVVRTVSHGYFEVMRIPLVAGRTFLPADNAAAPTRVVITQALAATLFPGQSVIGRQIWLGAADRMAEVIGIVGQVKHRALDEAVLPTIYLSAWQAPSPTSVIVVRSACAEADVVEVVREEVARLDAKLPVYGVRSMESVVAASPGVPARRVLTATFTGFSVLALALGAIGLFGVLAHDVASRRAELALRIALGAAPLRVATATLRQGGVMVGCGLATGALLTMWAARALSAGGIAVERLDALSVGVPAATIISVAAAALLPAVLRAIRTDPLISLRSE